MNNGVNCNQGDMHLKDYRVFFIAKLKFAKILNLTFKIKSIMNDFYKMMTKIHLSLIFLRKICMFASLSTV